MDWPESGNWKVFVKTSERTGIERTERNESTAVSPDGAATKVYKVIVKSKCHGRA